MKNVFLTVNVRSPKHSNNPSNDSTNAIIISISVAVGLCFIGIIVYIYFTKYKKNNNNNSIQNLSNEIIEPMYPKD